MRGPSSCHLLPPHSPAMIEGAVMLASTQSDACQAREQVTQEPFMGLPVKVLVTDEGTRGGRLRSTRPCTLWQEPEMLWHRLLFGCKHLIT